MNTGKMIISLDFELLWGMPNEYNNRNVKSQIIGGRKAIKRILNLFSKYEIHATWGVVGLLFAENKKDIYHYKPISIPTYDNDALNPYQYLESIGECEEEDLFHYAISLIKEIYNSKNQEIGTHTFSHYCCEEGGQTEMQFRQDLASAIGITQDKLGVKPTSLLLPRNQYNHDYLNLIRECGFTAARGNYKHYAYNHSTLLARGLRLLDTYTNILGNKCYDEKDCLEDGLVNVRSSIFFRRYNKFLFFLEHLKIYVIKRQMRYAAKHNKMFHLWWHPHNFGHNTEINLKQIEEILKYYKELNLRYGFTSCTMQEFANEILK